MMNPYRAVISDLDGTLLNENHQLDQITIDTLEKLASKGVDIFLATGRSEPDVSRIIHKTPLKQVTLITSNGARASNLTGDTLVSNYLPEEIALDLLTNVPFDHFNVCVNSYQGDEWFINVDVEQLKKYHQDSGFIYQVVDFKNHHGKQTEKVFYIARTAGALKPIEEFIRHKYDQQLQITYSTPQCLEVMAKDVCKAKTLDKLVTPRGYTLSDCIAFGDGMNDVEMLSMVGKGCVMGNADPRLKNALPKNEIIGDHKQQAVAYYLRELFGIS